MSRNDLLMLSKRLVAFNTVSGKTTVPMARFIANYLERCGFEIELYPYELEGVRKVNLIARKGGPSSHLVLAGHMDTVPAGNWKTDPWKLTESNEGFHGLGIADMKFFLAVMMLAGKAVPASELRHPLALVFTSDEEVGCFGAKRLVEDVKKAGRKIGDFVVIGEPTRGRPVLAHKGYVFFEVSVEALRDSHSADGERENPAHSSNPTVTTNVVEKGLPAVIEGLLQFKEQLELVRDPRFHPDYPTMNIGGEIIVGRRQMADKVAKNIIPRGVTIVCDLRPLPGQNPKRLVAILEASVRERVGRVKPTVPDEELRVTVKLKRAPTYPMDTDPDSLIVRETERISGYPAGTASFNTEGPVFNRSGSEVVIWGPPDIGQAHKADEFVPKELFNGETVERYIRLIRSLCLEGGG